MFGRGEGTPDELVIFAYTAEPAYRHIVHDRFMAIVDLDLVPFTFISLPLL